MVNRMKDANLEGIEDFIRYHCFQVTVNKNDTFAWGCADAEIIDVHDLPEALRLLKKYGSAGLDAFVIAKRRDSGHENLKNFGHSDNIKPYYPAEYWEKLDSALKELESYETYPGMFEEFGERFCRD